MHVYIFSYLPKIYITVDSITFQCCFALVDCRSFSHYFIMFFYANMSVTFDLPAFVCKLLVYPGAFNMRSGPEHWELLVRCRLVVNYIFPLLPTSSYTLYMYIYVLCTTYMYIYIIDVMLSITFLYFFYR